MRHSLRILGRAQADAREIASYLGKRSVDGMYRWLDAYEQAQDRIRAEPLSCGLAPENDRFQYELRQALFKTKNGRTYRAVFMGRGRYGHDPASPRLRPKAARQERPIA
ncbi:hypothetical protein Mal64_21160 [Pseudobythopirellula maris]|uniref:Uncharacterized protein n=1 Tax=Pseudobythopirellula maris TaxID=2527991 RepID=A0A5C5ZN81_9BACT|nr:hypothetical protein Mal64_21160 [Pseudobythopirellula maris]